MNDTAPTVLRSGHVYYDGHLAGLIEETDEGFRFTYDGMYLASEGARAVSLTLPLQEAAYHSRTLFPFFDGLIPEGWLLDITVKTWKVRPNDRMGLLLAVCGDCIGAVSVTALQTGEIS